MLGERLKELREAKGFVQRQVAALLEVDTAYVSKMERNEKPVSRSHIKKLSKLFEVEEKDLMPLWLADKVLQVVDDEQCAPDALTLALKELKSKVIKTRQNSKLNYRKEFTKKSVEKRQELQKAIYIQKIKIKD